MAKNYLLHQDMKSQNITLAMYIIEILRNY